MFYRDAFDALAGERAAAMSGTNRIPWRAVLAYAERYCVDEEQEEKMLQYIQVMDLAYVNWHNAKANRKMKDVKNHGNPRLANGTPRSHKRFDAGSIQRRG